MSDTPKKQFRLSDQAIGQIRELLQLSMITNSNFVDHCRALRLEESEQTEGAMILSKEYVEGWNKMAETFYAQAEEKAKQMGSTLASDVEEDAHGPDIIISRDPATGKLVGSRVDPKAQN